MTLKILRQWQVANNYKKKKIDKINYLIKMKNEKKLKKEK